MEEYMQKMQNIMFTDTDSNAMLPVQQSGGLNSHFKAIPTINLVELGKRLLLAARDGKVEQVRYLMTKGAPFTTDCLGTSPLHLAAQGGHYTMCEILLRAGISRDAKTKVDRTPLHMAAYEGHADVVRLLLTNGADANCTDMLKMTPLHWAVERENEEVVAVLMQYGADPCAISKFNKTPFTLAMEKNNLIIIQIMQSGVSESSEIAQSADSLEEAALASQNLAEELEHESTEVDLEAEGEFSETPPVEVIDIEEHQNTHAVKPPLILKSPTLRPVRRPSRIEEDPDSTASTLELLQAHGITMLPADETSLVASALENGQTVVLTEAGKLALNLEQEINSPPAQKFVAIPVKKKKMITIKAGQLFSVTGNKISNVTKRASVQNEQVKMSKMFLTSNRTPVPTGIKQKDVVNATASYDLEAVTRELEEARREAEQYKVLLSKKEREAEEYKQKLQSLVHSD